MAFEPDKITKQHVLDAVKKIERENIQLEPSTRLDVVINGKAYPPKEVMRYAHELMNGEPTWRSFAVKPLSCERTSADILHCNLIFLCLSSSYVRKIQIP